MQQQQVQPVEDPNGIPTGTPRIMVQRYNTASYRLGDLLLRDSFE